MTAIAVKVYGRLGPRRPLRLPRLNGRWVPVLAVAALAASPGELGSITRAALVDAYLQVSVFVTLTLALFYAAEAGLRMDTAAWLERHRRWQVPVAALLGMTPGCGGAIMVMTLYARGRIGFGAVVATLTGTMGDAAFLLIAREPATAVVVMGLSLLVGVVSGYAVEAMRGRPAPHPAREGADLLCLNTPRPADRADWAWMLLSLPGLVLGVLMLAQVELDALLPAWVDDALGVAGALLAFALWGRHKAGIGSPCHGQDKAGARDQVLVRISDDASFVSVWVVGAFLAYGIAAGYLGVDVAGWFQAWAPLLPLMGVLVGLIPGCGPQVVVTTLYLTGAVPFSALIGNAISNDGDALFPALAMAPRGAMLATLYSTVPALVVAYAAYALGY